MMDAASITDSIDREAWPQALALALEAWRTRRWVALAELVDALGARCLVDHPRSELDWRDRATTYAPVEAGALLAEIDDYTYVKRPEPSAHAKRRREAIEAILTRVPYSHGAERLAYLCSWPADPRITDAVVRWCEQISVTWPISHYYYGTTQGLDELRRWFAIVATCLRGVADRRVAARLRALADEPPGRSRGVRAAQQEIALAALAVIERLEEAPGEEAARIEALVDRVGRIARPAPAPPGPSYAAEGLWSRIAANAADDEARLVLADELLGRGDPRGELFTLHLRAAKPARAGSLIKRYWRTWLGEDLARILMRKHAVWTRGMLDVVRVGPGSTPGFLIDRVAGHRELVAVRAVQVNQLHPPDYARFIGGLPNVQVIMVDSVAIAEALVANGALEAVTTIVIAPRNYGENTSDVARTLAGNVPALATLVLETTPAQVGAVLELRASFPGVELVIAKPPSDPALRAALAATPDVQLVEGFLW